MKVKYKILTVNILVVFVSILTVLTGVFSVLMKMFSSKDKGIRNISVAAESTINFTKEGLLDLVGEGAFVNISNPIEINSQEKAIQLYNDFINNYYLTGKVKMVSSTLVIGGGELMGMGETYWGIFNEEKYYKDGISYSKGVYCKIPNAEGKDDGNYAPDNFIEERVTENGISTRRYRNGEKDVCYYVNDNGGYKIIINNSDFNGEEVKENATGEKVLPFEINTETISNCVIDSSSSFVTKVKFIVKDSALSSYKESIKNADYRNKDVPRFSVMDLEVSFNKYTGEIIEITKYENYTLPSQIDVDMTRSSNIIFKKED